MKSLFQLWLFAAGVTLVFLLFISPVLLFWVLGMWVINRVL
jgi:hypothetical protein